MSKLDRLLWLRGVMAEAGIFEIRMPMNYLAELYMEGYEVNFYIDGAGSAVVNSNEILG